MRRVVHNALCDEKNTWKRDARTDRYPVAALAKSKIIFRSISDASTFRIVAPFGNNPPRNLEKQYETLSISGC